MWRTLRRERSRGGKHQRKHQRRDLGERWEGSGALKLEASLVSSALTCVLEPESAMAVARLAVTLDLAVVEPWGLIAPATLPPKSRVGALSSADMLNLKPPAAAQQTDAPQHKRGIPC